MVAVAALPVKAPTNVVEVTEVSPAKVVTVEPRDTDVEPIVTALFVNALFGIPVKFVPVMVGVLDQLGVAPAPFEIATCPAVPTDALNVSGDVVLFRVNPAPDSAPVAATEVGVRAPSVSVIAGVVPALVTEPLTPFAVVIDTVVTVPVLFVYPDGFVEL